MQRGLFLRKVGGQKIMPSFLSLHYYIPYYITALIILAVIYYSYATTNGGHRFGMHVGRRLCEVALIAIAGFLLPNVKFGSVPGLNLIWSDLNLYQLAIVWGVIGLVVSSVAWFFKHDFNDHSSKLYVGQTDNEVRRTVNVVVTHEVVTREDDEKKAAEAKEEKK